MRSGILRLKDDDGKTYELEGAIELHRLVVEDLNQLERRADEMDEAVFDATCSVDVDEFKGVSVVLPHPPSLFLRSRPCFLPACSKPGTRRSCY